MVKNPKQINNNKNKKSRLPTKVRDNSCNSKKNNKK